MQIITDNYKRIDRAVDNAIKSMQVILPVCIRPEDLKSQAFYIICKRIDRFNPEKGSIESYCFKVAKCAIINFLQYVSPYQYQRSRSIAISDDPDICKVKEINFEPIFDLQSDIDIFDLVAVEDIFERTIARLRPRERFLAIMVYQQGWNTEDIMSYFKLDAIKAKNLRSYMQKRFRENMQELRTEC